MINCINLTFLVLNLYEQHDVNVNEEHQLIYLTLFDAYVFLEIIQSKINERTKKIQPDNRTTFVK
jgi:hypothetical protein